MAGGAASPVAWRSRPVLHISVDPSAASPVGSWVVAAGVPLVAEVAFSDATGVAVEVAGGVASPVAWRSRPVLHISVDPSAASPVGSWVVSADVPLVAEVAFSDAAGVAVEMAGGVASPVAWRSRPVLHISVDPSAASPVGSWVVSADVPLVAEVAGSDAAGVAVVVGGRLLCGLLGPLSPPGRRAGRGRGLRVGSCWLVLESGCACCLLRLFLQCVVGCRGGRPGTS